jgi:hypothetical protein
VLQVLAALEALLTLGPLVFSDKPTLRNNSLLPACLDKVSPPVTPLVAVRSVRKVHYPVLPLMHLCQVRTLPDRSHPFLGRPLNNSLPPAVALVCLDLSSSRIPRGHRVLRGSLGVNRYSDRPMRVNLGSSPNRADVSYASWSTICVFTNPELSIWQRPGPTAYFWAVWSNGGRRSVWKRATARCSAATRPSACLQYVREQNNHSNNGGRDLWQQPHRPAKHDYESSTNEPFRKYVWTVEFSTGKQSPWGRHKHVWPPVSTRCWRVVIHHTTPWRFNAR